MWKYQQTISTNAYFVQCKEWMSSQPLSGCLIMITYEKKPKWTRLKFYRDFLFFSFLQVLFGIESSPQSVSLYKFYFAGEGKNPPLPTSTPNFTEGCLLFCRLKPVLFYWLYKRNRKTVTQIWHIVFRYTALLLYFLGKITRKQWTYFIVIRYTDSVQN